VIQNFYIDPEEEITSILGRVRKAQAQTFVLVVPNSALILGSLINMKLLARESKRIGKEIIIVTQDETGLANAKKSGLRSGRTVDEFVPSKLVTQKRTLSSETSNTTFQSENTAYQKQGSVKNEPKNARVVDSMSVHTRRSKSLSGIVSAEPGAVMPRNRQISERVEEFSVVDQEKLINSQKQMSKDEQKSEIKQSQPSLVSGRSEIHESERMQSHSISELQKQEASSGKVETGKQEVKKVKEKELFIKTLSQQKNVSVNNTQSVRAPQNTITPEKQDKDSTSNRIKATIVVFVILSVFIIGGVLAYVFFPKAHIIVHAQKIVHTIGYDLTAEKSTQAIQVQDKKIPLTIQEEVREAKKEFESSGRGELGNQKSTGKVVISNRYSTENQPLVATTRLITEDGKLYRLTESVVVPGTSKNNEGDVIAGEVEVMVKADIPGSEFNIEPSTFTIPGFKGTDKYEKFSARSEKAFVGGASGESQYTFISEEDVRKAQEALENELKEVVIARLTETIATDRETLKKLVFVKTIESSTLPSVGTVSKSFTHAITAQIKVAEFPGMLLEQALLKSLKEELKNNSSVKQWEEVSFQIFYEKIQTDFEKERVKIQVEAQGQFAATINAQEIKEDMLGKKSDEFSSVIENHPELEKIDIEFSPGIFSQKIPRFESRVSVEVK